MGGTKRCDGYVYDFAVDLSQRIAETALPYCRGQAAADLIVKVRMNAIRSDMSQFYPLKAALEQILGERTYRKLKETATLPDWKLETKKLLKAIELSIIETVKVADADFYTEAKEILELGHAHIKSAKEISELFASLSATLTRLVFLQIDYIPAHHRVESISLAQKNWNFSCVRSVQYVQSIAQKKTAKWIEDRKNDARQKNSP